MDRRDALLIGATAAVGGYIAQKELLFGSEESNKEADTTEPTETETETPEPDEESTPVSDENSSNSSTYEIGEQFELSNVEYLVRSVHTADSLGNEINTVEPDGVFLVSVVSVSNNRDDVIAFPGNNFRISSQESWSYPDEEVTKAGSDDDRIEVDAWNQTSIAAGTSKTGIAVFDVDPNVAVDLWFLSVTEEEELSAYVALSEPRNFDTISGILKA